VGQKKAGHKRTWVEGEGTFFKNSGEEKKCKDPADERPKSLIESRKKTETGGKDF